MSTRADLENARPLRPRVSVGLESFVEQPPPRWSGARFGLLMNQASLDAQFRYAHHLLAQRFPGQLRAIFSPQHGLWGEEQANMIETPHGREQALGVPLYSLYSQSRRPAPAMLDGLDLLVVDLQDVGTRVYTFIWTVSHCLEACCERQLPVLVLDRPNPLGGAIEGPCLDPAYASFVGRAPIPMRHGLTLGELALWVNDHLQIGAQVEVVPLRGWERPMRFDETGRAWVPPSPNLARLEGVEIYPGGVLWEGTNLSEGRGTTTPFELVGAPYVEPRRLREALEELELPGVVFREVRFRPTFDKWQQTSCGGVFLHVVDRQCFRPYLTGLAVMAAVKRLWPAAFAWLPPPYEYETEKMPIDILTGSAAVREAIDHGACRDRHDLEALAATDALRWRHQTERHRIYGGW